MATKKRKRATTVRDLEDLAHNFRADLEHARSFLQIGASYLESMEQSLSPEAIRSIAKNAKGKIRTALHRRIDELIPL
jgi:hypothetical protein